MALVVLRKRRFAKRKGGGSLPQNEKASPRFEREGVEKRRDEGESMDLRLCSSVAQEVNARFWTWTL